MGRIISAAMILSVVSGALARAEGDALYSKLLAEKSPVLVTIKFVLKMQGQFGDRESEAEATGVMIDPSGLVLCGNSQLGMPAFMRRFGTATPTDLKVLVGDDTEGLKATVLARDTELDLAWVKIKDPGDRKFAFLDLSQLHNPVLGERLFSLRRMAKYFDRATTMSEGRLSGRTRKPRELLVPSGDLSVEPGLPVFTADGHVVGVAVLQMPDDEEREGNPMAFIGVGRDISRGLILPAGEVARATLRARENAGREDDDESAGQQGADPAKRPPDRKESGGKRSSGGASKEQPEEEDEDEGGA